MAAELLQDSDERAENTTIPPVVEEKKENDEDRNWKAFLEKRKEEQRLFDAEKEKNKKLEEDRAHREKELEDLKIAFQVMVDKKESSSSFDDGESDQKKFVQDEIQKLFREENNKKRIQDENERIYRDSIAIKQEMPDLLEVCNQENLAYLEYYNPEIAIPLGKMPDGLEKTKLAYQAIKKHVKMAKKEKEKVEQNLSKPKSVHSAYSNETTSDKENTSGVLSDKRRNETWQKMQRLISGEDED